MSAVKLLTLTGNPLPGSDPLEPGDEAPGLEVSIMDDKLVLWIWDNESGGSAAIALTAEQFQQLRNVDASEVK